MAAVPKWYVPGLNPAFSGIAFTNFVVSTTTSACEWIFNTPEAITITRLGFRYGARALTPPAYIISLQGVDASGNPDGVIKGGGTPASHVFTPPADTSWDGLWKWQTLDNPFTTTRGQFLAGSIAYSSGTIDGTNNSSFTVISNMHAGTQGFPYAIQNASGTRTKLATGVPCFGYASAGTAYGWPHHTAYVTAITASTTPDELAMAFQLDGNYGATYQVVGVRLPVQCVAASSFAVNLYSGTTILQTVTVDADYDPTPSGNNFFEVYFTDTTLATLNFGQLYRVGFQPVGTTGTWTLRGMTFAAAADMAAWPGGSQFYLSTRTDAGAWSDDTATRPFADLIVSDWTKPAAVGPRIMVAGGGMSASALA